MQASRWAILGVLLLLAGCSTPHDRKPESVEPQWFSTAVSYDTDRPLQCKAMLDSYCNILFSPQALGNLRVQRGTASASPIMVLQGETTNDIPQTLYHYSIAKIRHQDQLPSDFQRVLKKQNYFEKLARTLERLPRTQMTLSERLQSEQERAELNTIWASALDEIVMVRMDRKFPGFHSVPDRLVPLEISLERRRIYRDLVSSISKSLWHADENWTRVEFSFDKMKIAYVKMISKLEVDDAIKTAWTKRITDVKLVLPGSMPAISDEECSSTKINAYYYKYLNVLTVCAGDFNSEDIMQTIAHEMGHSLDVDRSSYLFEVKSDFGVRLANLREKVCEPKSFTCDDWYAYKSQFGASLNSLNGFKPDLPEFQRCLKRRETSKVLTADDIKRFANSMTADRLSDLSSSDRFLRITKGQIPMINGKNQKNPAYLNPCSYYLWSHGEEPVDDDLTTLMYFTAEYRCSDHVGAERFKSAIEVAKGMTEEVLEKTVQVDGEFSSNARIDSEGFASPPYERFADVVGSYAMAEMLKELPTNFERQNKLLASSSWQCEEPSLSTHFPEESAIQSEYEFDSHTDGAQRKKELLSAPIREAVGCKKDFEFNECSLPIKK